MNLVQRSTPRIGGALILFSLLAGSTEASQGAGKTDGQTAPKQRPVELVLPLDRLEQANVQAAEVALESLTRTAYSCPVCLFTQPVEGACPDCDEELEPSEGAIHPVRRADVDAGERTMRLFLASGQTLRLSEVEHALKKSGAELEREAIPMLPWSRLVLDVTDDEQGSEELREALETLPFEIVAFQLDDGTTRATALLGRHEKGDRATLGDVRRALKQASAPFTLADVVWSGPCKVCAESGAAVATCRKCTNNRGTDRI